MDRKDVEYKVKKSGTLRNDTVQIALGENILATRRFKVRTGNKLSSPCSRCLHYLHSTLKSPAAQYLRPPVRSSGLTPGLDLEEHGPWWLVHVTPTTRTSVFG